MGHEVLVYRDRHAIVNDFDLWAIRHFLIAEAEVSAKAELASFVRAWDWIGPGVYIGIDFDTFLDSDLRREQEFLDLLDAAAKRIHAFGKEVPLDYLKHHVNRRGARFKFAQPVERLVGLIERVRQIVAAVSPTG